MIAILLSLNHKFNKIYIIHCIAVHYTFLQSSLHAQKIVGLCICIVLGNASQKTKESRFVQCTSFICLYYTCPHMEYLIMYCFTGSLFTNLRNLVRLPSAEGLPRTEVVRRSMCSGRLGSVGPESTVPHHVRCTAVSS